jgi:hypothetical protein
MPEEGKPQEAPNPFRKLDDAKDAYEIVADVVGGVPSLRWKDNLIQGLSILGAVILGTPAGWLIVGEWWGLLVGAFCGLLVGLLLSGIVLMILGWVRTARKMNKP